MSLNQTKYQLQLLGVYTGTPRRQLSFADSVVLIVSKDTGWQRRMVNKINKFGFSQIAMANNSKAVNERVFCANSLMLILYDTITCGEVNISSSSNTYVVPCSSLGRHWLNTGVDGILYQTCWKHANMCDQEMQSEFHLARIRAQSEAV